MARKQVSGNRDEFGNADSSSTNVVLGGDGKISSEDIRADEGSVSGKTEGESTGIFDPAQLDNPANEPGESGGEEWFPKRNKKRGRTPKANKEAAADLNGLLWMVHQGLSTLTGVEELAIDSEESKELATSIARVQAFYPNSVMSPQVMAWTGLFITLGKIYGTRAIAIVAKKKKKPELVTIPPPIGTVAVNEVIL